MEEKRESRPHSISWKDRKQGIISGVTDVVSFDDTSVILQTSQGRLTIKGKDFHVSKLMLEAGEVEVEGMPESMTYSGSHSQTRKNFVRRMFQ